MGSGLRNMAGRLAALGGRLEVRSAPGQGTTITGYLPVPAASGSQQAPETPLWVSRAAGIAVMT
jgi:signal transduction histidine kinase